MSGAGTVQTFVRSRSISLHFAATALPLRAVVKIAYSNALAAMLPRARSSAMNSGISLIVHGGMVRPFELWAAWQDECQIFGPARRVFAAAPFVRLGIIQSGFNPAAHPRSRFIDCRPDWLQCFENMNCVYLVDRHIAKAAAIRVKGIIPLPRMFLIAPL